jgi:hypothetical protein
MSNMSRRYDMHLFIIILLWFILCQIVYIYMCLGFVLLHITNDA